MEDDEEKDEQRKEEESVERTLGQDSQNGKFLLILLMVATFDKTKMSY